MTRPFRHLDLFSGIGGFALAVRWLGGTTVAFCEIEPYCQRVLRKHWPDVPIWEDVHVFRDIVAHAASLRCARRAERERGGTKEAWWLPKLGAVDLLTAGVPCQPASVAGKRKGSEDDRWLWPVTVDVVRAVRPRFVVLENVPGLIGLKPHGLDWVCGELEAAGYQCVPVLVGADDVGAPHRRKRVWIVGRLADCEDQRSVQRGREGRDGEGPVPTERGRVADSRRDGGTGRGTTGDVAGEARDLEGASRQQRLRNPAGDVGAARMADSPLWQGDGRGTGSVGRSAPSRGSGDTAARAGCEVAHADCPVRRELRGAVTGRKEHAAAEHGRDPMAYGVSGTDSGRPRGPSRGSGVSSDAEGVATRERSEVDDVRQTEPLLGGTPDGLPARLDGRWPSRPGQTQYPWEPPRTTTERVPNRAARLKALGNAIVPQVAYHVIKALLDTDR